MSTGIPVEPSKFNLDGLERRPFEVRAVGERIVGLAIPFDTRSRDLGGFVEVVKPQAVDRSLRADIVALFHHNPEAILGRTPTTLQLKKEARGLAFTIAVPNTQLGRETLELVRRQDLTGASFGFRTIADAWKRDGDITIRELLDIEIGEISLTAFPAYQQTDVSVAQRSMQAWQKESALSFSGQRIDWLRKMHVARGV
jgi:HK97 family phage prohead protease